MSASYHSPITDELLSAYLDNALTAEEKMLVDVALQNEPTVAWRLESLRQTITLLHNLPAVSLPRSFALSELQIAEQATPAKARSSLPRPAKADHPAAGLAGLWEAWRAFWQVGTPWLRNAAAVSFALLLIFIAGDYALPALPGSQPLAKSATTRQAEAEIALVAPQTSAASDEETAQPLASGAAATVAPATESAQRRLDPPVVAAAAANEEAATPSLDSAADMAEPVTQPSAAVSAPLPEAPSAGESGGSLGSTQALQLPDVGRAPGPDSTQERMYYQESGGEQPLIAESLSAVLAATESVTSAAEAAITETSSLSETTLLTETVPVSETTALTAGVASSTGGPAEQAAVTEPGAVATPATDAWLANVEQAAATLPLFQLAAGGLTLLFAWLWWRSRSSAAVKS